MNCTLAVLYCCISCVMDMTVNHFELFERANKHVGKGHLVDDRRGLLSSCPICGLSGGFRSPHEAESSYALESFSQHKSLGKQSLPAIVKLMSWCLFVFLSPLLTTMVGLSWNNTMLCHGLRATLQLRIAAPAFLSTLWCSHSCTMPSWTSFNNERSTWLVFPIQPEKRAMACMS